MLDFYSDDPVEESSGKRKNFAGIFTLILLIALGGTFLQTTLAANMNLNSGIPIEFGQGVTATTACSGATSLTLTPTSSFVNDTGSGAFYFTAVKVANIPSSCHGKDFSISAFGSSSSTPLPIFNSTATRAVVYNNAGTFELGNGTTTGASITSGSGTFTLTFTNPVAASGSVFKLTIQSSEAQTVVYNVGDLGPGGGRIFYKNVAGFNCGPTHSATGSPTGGKCNYLEAAPADWKGGGSQPLLPWATGTSSSGNAISDVVGIENEESSPLNALGIGLGYKNSLLIIAQGNDDTTAAGRARAYSGASKSDWYLPSGAELNLACQWNRGVTQDVSTVCSGGSLNSGTGASSAPWINYTYYSSSERNATEAWFQYFQTGQLGYNKSFAMYLRPIRAF